MKHYLWLLLFLLVPCLTFGQEVLETFDAAPDSGYWFFERVASSTQTFTNLTYGNAQVKQGTGSLKVDYAIQGTESYGGYANIMHGAPGTELFDFSPYSFYHFQRITK